MTEDHTGNPQDRTALIALLKIFSLVVLSNVVLYLVIVYFSVLLFHRSVPSFLAFIQFLAFILPIALILRLGLREAPTPVAVENLFLKKMGATPTLVVLSRYSFHLTVGGRLNADQARAVASFFNGMPELRTIVARTAVSSAYIARMKAGQ